MFNFLWPGEEVTSPLSFRFRLRAGIGLRREIIDICINVVNSIEHHYHVPFFDVVFL